MYHPTTILDTEYPCCYCFSFYIYTILYSAPRCLPLRQGTHESWFLNRVFTPRLLSLTGRTSSYFLLIKAFKTQPVSMYQGVTTQRNVNLYRFPKFMGIKCTVLSHFLPVHVGSICSILAQHLVIH